MQGLKRALLQIWRLTYPYYVTREETQIRIWPFGTFRLQERWVALSMAVLVIGIEFAQVAINVRLSYFNRDWFNAIQSKDAVAFWALLFSVFCFWAAIYVGSAIIQYVIQSFLRIRWRAWMTRHYVDRWLGNDTHYRMGLTGARADNPDQRIADDIDQFTQTTQTLAISFLSAVSNLVSFSVILWNISAVFTVPGTDWHVPGFLVWGALIYSGLVTWLTHLIGRPLIRLNFEQQRREADFRFSLARLREYGEQVALLSGGAAERASLRDRFGALIANFYAIVDRRKRLSAFTVSYQQVNVVIPYILVAPYYFAGQIQLGMMTQTAGAFARVESTMSFFITFYVTLADYKAQVDRLTSFDAAMERAEAMRAQTRLVVAPGAGAALQVRDLALGLPDGRRIAAVRDLVLEPGETTLLTGPSGSGKSTLFRALAGIWPFGEGTVRTPAGATLMLLPQRPYLPMGTLRMAATYPDASGRHDDAAIREALEAARLPHLVTRLDEEAPWAQTLSLGEQQRLAIARALLAKPDWLFLDEATAAVDEPTEAALYRMLRQRLPGTTLVSIGHRSTLDAFHQRRLDMTPRHDGVFVPTDLRTPVAAQ
ncbi:ABC transporter ATP-binding protein/permease [Methylobacterium nodulans]|uniref:ABC transporter domain protein n=1 Tax=Methylobacterium nodulans (strain LMG 21967 / CNCM I-2342 / ORS 2060) TaxID=460265 RepID=B8IDX7_METNO|nr:ABC transporter ATP-binding protein/permease [Methylobacterium nodulans]ACL55699.1 ABC transporter domain protein [Methylobacterium nodulans ORS 2060]